MLCFNFSILNICRAKNKLTLLRKLGLTLLLIKAKKNYGLKYIYLFLILPK